MSTLQQITEDSKLGPPSRPATVGGRRKSSPGPGAGDSPGPGKSQAGSSNSVLELDPEAYRALVLREYRKARREKGHRFYIDALRESYARFIEWGFRGCKTENVWFATLTFRKDVSLPRAENLVREYIRRLSVAVGGHPRGKATRLRYALAREYQQRGVIHYHVIIHGVGLSNLSRRRWEEKWNRMAGYARIGTAHCSAVGPYLVKYITKGADVQVGGNWTGRTAPKRLDRARRSVISSSSGDETRP